MRSLSEMSEEQELRRDSLPLECIDEHPDLTCVSMVLMRDFTLMLWLRWSRCDRPPSRRDASSLSMVLNTLPLSSCCSLSASCLREAICSRRDSFSRPRASFSSCSSCVWLLAITTAVCRSFWNCFHSSDSLSNFEFISDTLSSALCFCCCRFLNSDWTSLSLVL